MKKRLLILVFIFSFSMIICAQKVGYANTEIVLQENGDRPPIKEKEKDPLTRSIHIQTAYAYINNNVITIVFEEILPTVTVTLIKETTGENIYSESYNYPITLNRDINGENNGSYVIRIESDMTSLEGHFSL